MEKSPPVPSCPVWSIPEFFRRNCRCSGQKGVIMGTFPRRRLFATSYCTKKVDIFCEIFLTRCAAAGNIMGMKTAKNGKSTHSEGAERGRRRLRAALRELWGRCVREREGQRPPHGQRYGPLSETGEWDRALRLSVRRDGGRIFFGSACFYAEIISK